MHKNNDRALFPSDQGIKIMASRTSQWFESLEDLLGEVGRLNQGDILALDRGSFKHYVVVIQPLPSNDIECLHMDSCGKLPGSGHRCIDPVGFGADRQIVKLVSLTQIIGDSKIRINNQYPLAQGIKERINKIGHEFFDLRLNCEAFVNYVRSEVVPDQTSIRHDFSPVSNHVPLPVKEKLVLMPARQEPFKTVWYDSYKILLQNVDLALHDVVAFDRGLFEHYAVITGLNGQDIVCVDLQKSDAMIGSCCPNSNSSTTGCNGEIRRVPLSEVAQVSVADGRVLNLQSVASYRNKGSKKKESKIRIYNKFHYKPGFNDRLRLAESGSMIYKFFCNNCEHFANYLRSDKKVSEQVEDGILIGVFVAIGAICFVAAASLFGESAEEEREGEQREQ